jgi:hypothetical protein
VVTASSAAVSQAFASNSAGKQRKSSSSSINSNGNHFPYPLISQLQHHQQQQQQQQQQFQDNLFNSPIQATMAPLATSNTVNSSTAPTTPLSLFQQQSDPLQVFNGNSNINGSFFFFFFKVNTLMYSRFFLVIS